MVRIVSLKKALSKIVVHGERLHGMEKLSVNLLPGHIVDMMESQNQIRSIAPDSNFGD
jgi:hypothetical protein